MLSRGAENFRIVFDGKGTDRLSWFSTNRRLSSPWPDLNGHTGDPYSINYMPDKTFAIKQFAIGCMMSGWMVVVEEGNTCTWSTDPFSYPQFLYSPSSSHAAFDVSGDRMLADDFVIYLNIKLA
ncbi:uncharacterized protein LOC135469096 [Liolophura sinensis]|uniref:uncharacterized protein LOC135469096 n=1 Tax=Liolophura sinensis TaxID=3198878 RepID=UPI0031598D98